VETESDAEVAEAAEPMTVRYTLTLACFGLVVSAAPEKLMPVDEAQRDPSLNAFRGSLLAVARRENASQLAALAAENVMFEEDELTPAAFAARIAALPTDERAKFWQELRDDVTFGMAYERGFEVPTLLAPYVSVLLRERAESDPEVMAITGRAVAVHERSQMSSPIIARLDYDIVHQGPDGLLPVEPGEFEGMYEWVHILMDDGRAGWVVSKYVYSVGEPRFAFRKTRGIWKLIGYWTAD